MDVTSDASMSDSGMCSLAGCEDPSASSWAALVAAPEVMPACTGSDRALYWVGESLAGAEAPTCANS
jgi:hypothetical protein